MITRYLAGPELLWLVFYGIAALVAKANAASPKSMDKFIENGWFWVPFLALLTFALWWIPAVEKRWLLLRVWVTCLVGGHLVLDMLMGAYSEQGPGIGMGYLAGIMLLFIILVAGSIFILIRFR